MSNEESEVTEAGPGSLLKQVREQQGLTIADVADRLKLMEQSVKNIEADDYKDIPLTFYKGYIKNYAQMLGLEADNVCEAFNRFAQNNGLDSGTRITPAYRREALKQRKSNKAARLFVKLISFLIVLAIVYSIYYLLAEKGYWNKFINSFDKQEAQQEQPLDVDENEGELIPDTDRALSLPLETSKPRESELAFEETTSNQGGNGALEENSLPIENTDMASSELAINASSDAGLSLVFSGDCWIQVVDATGRVLVSGTKSAGHISQVSGQEPYQLTIGKVSSVSIQHNGEDIDLSSFSDARIAKLALGE